MVEILRGRVGGLFIFRFVILGKGFGFRAIGIERGV